METENYSQWKTQNILSGVLSQSQIDLANSHFNDNILFGDRENFFSKLTIIKDHLNTEEISKIISIRSQYLLGVNFEGDWKDKIAFAKAIEENCQLIPEAFIKYNNSLKAFSVYDPEQIMGAAYNLGKSFIEFYPILTDHYSGENSYKLDDYIYSKEFKATLFHEIGHAISVNIGETSLVNGPASGGFLEFAKLCGWSEENASGISTAGTIENIEDIPCIPREHEHKLITKYAQVSSEEAFAEYFSAYILNKETVDNSISWNIAYHELVYKHGEDSRMTKQDILIFNQLKQILNNNLDKFKPMKNFIKENPIDPNPNTPISDFEFIQKDKINQGFYIAFNETREYLGRLYECTSSGYWRNPDYKSKGSWDVLGDVLGETKEKAYETLKNSYHQYLNNPNLQQSNHPDIDKKLSSNFNKSSLIRLVGHYNLVYSLNPDNFNPEKNVNEYTVIKDINNDRSYQIRNFTTEFRTNNETGEQEHHILFKFGCITPKGSDIQITQKELTELLESGKFLIDNSHKKHYFTSAEQYDTIQSIFNPAIDQSHQEKFLYSILQRQKNGLEMSTQQKDFLLSKFAIEDSLKTTMVLQLMNDPNPSKTISDFLLNSQKEQAAGTTHHSIKSSIEKTATNKSM